MRKVELWTTLLVVMSIGQAVAQGTAPGLSNETEGRVVSWLPWAAGAIVLLAILGYIFYKSRQTARSGTTSSKKGP